MMKVFVAGSRKISRFNDAIRNRLTGMIESDLEVLVGDANGVDKATQKHFAECGYPRVTVYHSGTEARNNLANWPTEQVHSTSKKKDFSFYMAKDNEMSERADFGFMIWDGESKGTLNNILNLIERQKTVVVYFGPQKECVTVSAPAELEPMLRQCSDKALATFEMKIDLGARLNGGQQKLTLA